MPVRRNARGRWIYRTLVKLKDGTKVRIFGTPTLDTKEAAQEAERAHILRVLNPLPDAVKKEVPTYEEWFWGSDSTATEPIGRFWIEWVVARKNKPSEVESKQGIYTCHLRNAFGKLRLNEIDESAIARFRASLLAHKIGENRTMSEKRINNILAVLSKSLRYAHRVRLIDNVPDIGMFKVERPEIEALGFEEYARLLAAAAKDYEPEWYAAVCLAGEAGLRVGEVKALRWEDVDLIAGTLTVQRQVRYGKEGTPKGRTKRVVMLTPTLRAALKKLSVIRTGYVIRNHDGSYKGDQQAKSAMERICKCAGLPSRGWHILRHTFGTHAAMFGCNPWSLMTWMGHKTISETMRYVHVANAHRRQIPEEVLRAAGTEIDPDRRVLLMLGARRGTPVAPTAAPNKEAEETSQLN
jgi:integrase